MGCVIGISGVISSARALELAHRVRSGWKAVPSQIFATRLRECVMWDQTYARVATWLFTSNFSRTEMGNSTSLPNRLLDLGWLSKPVDIFKEKHNRHYQVFARDGKVYQSEYGLDDKGKETFRHTEELAYVVGTGANGVTPIVRRGNYLFQAPISYYTARKAWDLSPNYEVRDLGFSLPVTADCIGCHTGRTQPVPGREKDGLYGDPPIPELAIGCENCHGPGELHVNERLAGKPAPLNIDRSIVNPARLSPWLADNICMNCHEGDIRALQPGKTEADFRPGTPLNSTVAILKAPIDPRSTESPLLEHYYSMTLSRCYRASSGHSAARIVMTRTCNHRRRSRRNTFAASACSVTPTKAVLSICKSVSPSNQPMPVPPAICSDSRHLRFRTQLSPTTAFFAHRASRIPRAPSKPRRIPGSFTSIRFREKAVTFRLQPCCAPTVRNSFVATLNTRTTISPSWIGWQKRTTKTRSCSRRSPRKRQAMEI